jgi:hypothetical protein
MLAKAQSSTQVITEHQNSSPSPTTILRNVHSSGNFICSQRSNTEAPSPVVKYHEPSSNVDTPMNYENNNHYQNQFTYPDDQRSPEQQINYHDQYNNSFNNYQPDQNNSNN